MLRMSFRFNYGLHVIVTSFNGSPVNIETLRFIIAPSRIFLFTLSYLVHLQAKMIIAA